jgi:predicted esterase
VRTGADAAPGLQPLGLSRGRDGLLYVPRGYAPERPAPLVVLLHGAGGTARHGMELLQAQADAAGLLLLAPDARGPTWDVILGGYGPDVRYLDAALAHVFDRYAVDTELLAVGGFSDGASYALCLGLANGDFFRHVVAFSPGFAAPPVQVGRPRLYLSHGTEDTVLPIDRCGRRLARTLEGAGYAVRYHEFEGPHVVPPAIREEAVRWLRGETH